MAISGEIGEWQKMDISQAAYCVDKKLSITAFSKWKKKLHPNIKARHPVYRVRSKYYKFTKLPDEKIEALMKCFLKGMPAKQASEKTGIKQNSIYKFYNDFRLALVNGALVYPHLFFHTGVLLMLGAPPFLDNVIAATGNDMPAQKPNRRYAQLRYVKNMGWHEAKALKSNMQVLSALLIFYSTFKWELDEGVNYRNEAYRVFYKYSYATDRGLNPDIVVKPDLVETIAREIPKTIVARANWNSCYKGNERKSLLSEEFWVPLFRNRKFRNVTDPEWIKEMLKDFRWLLRRHKISEKHQVRSAYWDEIKPDLEKAHQSRMEQTKERLRIFPKKDGQWTLSELVAFGELQKEKK